MLTSSHVAQRHGGASARTWRRARGAGQPGVVAQMLRCPVLAVLLLALELAQTSLLHASTHSGGISLEMRKNPWGNAACSAQGDCLHVCMGI